MDRDFAKYQRKQLCNAMIDLLPKRLIIPVLNAAGLSLESSAGQTSAKARKHLVHVLQALPMTIVGTRPLAEAIVTEWRRVKSIRVPWNRRLFVICILPESLLMLTHLPAATIFRQPFRWDMQPDVTAYGIWRGSKEDGETSDNRASPAGLEG